MAESWRVAILSEQRLSSWLFNSEARAIEHIQEFLAENHARWGLNSADLAADPKVLATTWPDITSGSEWIELSRVDSTI